MRLAFAGAVIAALSFDQVEANAGRHKVYQAINSGELTSYDSDKQTTNQLVNIINSEPIMTDGGWGISLKIDADISWGYNLIAWWYPYNFRDAIIFNPQLLLEIASHSYLGFHFGDWWTIKFWLEGVAYRFNIFDVLQVYDPETGGYCYDATFWTEVFYAKLYIQSTPKECHEGWLDGGDSGSIGHVDYKNIL